MTSLQAAPFIKLLKQSCGIIRQIMLSFASF